MQGPVHEHSEPAGGGLAVRRTGVRQGGTTSWHRWHSPTASSGMGPWRAAGCGGRADGRGRPASAMHGLSKAA